MKNKITGWIEHPFVAVVISIIITYIIVAVSDIPDKYEDFDAWLLTFVVFFKLGAALFMLVRTRWRDWTILGAGLCAGFAAIGFLYLLTVINYYQGSYAHLEDLVSLVRSMLLISGIFIITGMTQEWWIDGGYSWRRIKHRFKILPKWWLRNIKRYIRRKIHGNEKV